MANNDTTINYLQGVFSLFSCVVAGIFTTRVILWNAKKRAAEKGAADHKPSCWHPMCCCSWTYDALELQVTGLGVSATLQGLTSGVFSLRNAIHGSPMSQDVWCTLESLSISAFGLATVLFGISTPVLAMAGKLKYLNPGDPRCSRIITVAVVVLAVVAAVIPWVFGVVGPDDGGCWIDDNMNKTKLLEWQLGLFHLWLVLAWLGASFLFGYMMLMIYKSRLRVESEGWPSDIRCYLLLVIAVYVGALVSRVYAWATPGQGSPMSLVYWNHCTTSLLGTCLPIFYRLFVCRKLPNDSNSENPRFMLNPVSTAV